MLPVKNRRDREEKSVPPVFFLPVGEMKKCTEKEQKKNEKICKKQLTFVRGFDIIILALSDRAKLIKSH